MSNSSIDLVQKTTQELKINKKSIIKILTTVLIVTLVGATSILVNQNIQLRKQFQPKPSTLHKSSVEVSQETRREIADKKWQSPSGEKYITYKYSTDFDEYRLHLFNKERELNIGRMNEPVAELEINWSPNETYVVVSNTDDFTRIFCIDADSQECNGKVVFYVLGGVSVYWSDNQTAYICYGNKGNDIVSRLTFPPDTIYPREQIIYKEPWNAFFAYRPVSISPDNTYLVMERRYEGPPVLAIMNTQTGKIIEPRKNDELYILGSSPNYAWNGNLLTFTGGLTINGSWLELADETHAIDDNLLEKISVDVSILN